jgi:hypothetical protein
MVVSKITIKPINVRFMGFLLGSWCERIIAKVKRRLGEFPHPEYGEYPIQNRWVRCERLGHWELL